MNLLFKINDGVPIENNIIGDTNFQEHFADVNVNTSWTAFKTHIRQATSNYIIPHIGQDFYTKIAEKYEKNVALSDKESNVLMLLQDAIAYFTIYKAMPTMNIVVGDAGIQQNTPEKSSPTSQWAFHLARDSAFAHADNNLDMLLNYLDKNIADFPSYKNSDEAKVGLSDFVRNSNTACEYLKIKGSRRTFSALVPFFKQVEKKKILPVICDELYLKLKNNVDNLSDKDKKLMELIQSVVCNFGLWYAAPQLKLSIEADGFKVVSNTDGFTDKRNMTNNNHTNAIESLRNELELQGKEAEKNLISFLYKNEADYPEWAKSDYRTKASKSINIISRGQGGFWM